MSEEEVEEPEGNTVAANYNMRCPKCGSDDSIEVQVTTWVALVPEGTDESMMNNDKEWDSESPAQCVDCYFSGTVLDFDIERPCTCDANEESVQSCERHGSK